MKVKELIKKLKKMPQDAVVFSAAHDNSEYEIGSDTNYVDHLKKKDCDLSALSMEEHRVLETMPKEWVTIHG